MLVCGILMIINYCTKSKMLRFLNSESQKSLIKCKHTKKQEVIKLCHVASLVYYADQTIPINSLNKTF